MGFRGGCPYLAVLILVEGLIYRVIQWARSPVPFRIPTTGGQGRSLPWIERDLAGETGQPRRPPAVWSAAWPWKCWPSAACSGTCGRSCVKDPDNPEGARLIHWSYKWLWLGAIAFHYAFLVVILRHLRFFHRAGAGRSSTMLDNRGRLLAVLHAGGVPERRGAGGGGDLSAVPADHQSDPALHLPGGGLLPPAPDPGHRHLPGF